MSDLRLQTQQITMRDVHRIAELLFTAQGFTPREAYTAAVDFVVTRTEINEALVCGHRDVEDWISRLVQWVEEASL